MYTPLMIALPRPHLSVGQKLDLSTHTHAEEAGRRAGRPAGRPADWQAEWQAEWQAGRVAGGSSGSAFFPQKQYRVTQEEASEATRSRSFPSPYF